MTDPELAAWLYVHEARTRAWAGALLLERLEMHEREFDEAIRKIKRAELRLRLMAGTFPVLCALFAVSWIVLAFENPSPGNIISAALWTPWAGWLQWQRWKTRK